jgi:OFA family oxalate/formate antiporter-like MFS transporter
MFLLQAGLFFLLPRVHSFGLFTALAVVILLCYGGGFGTMPAFCADYFGVREVGPIYGLMLTAWGCGSALGPMLIAHMRQSTGGYGQALLILAGIMIVAVAVPLFLRAPGRPGTVKAEDASEPAPQFVCH